MPEPPRARTDWFAALPSGKWERGFLRIGHSGAGALAAPNTLSSLALAVEMGVDMVEFDVRPCLDALVLLHDDDLSHFGRRQHLASQTPYSELSQLDVGQGERIPTFLEALDLLKGRALLNVDLKASGYEEVVLEALERYGLLGETLVSSLETNSLRQVRQLYPQVRTSLSYPADRANASRRPFLKPAVNAALFLMRLTLPGRVLRMMERAHAMATTLHFRVISPALIRAVNKAGGQVYAWTVDTPKEIKRLADMGVDGVASNRPDLFPELK